MDSHLQDRLQSFSAKPPESVWDKIADSLDADGSLAFRLHQYEQLPPVNAWSKIEKDLGVPAKEISFVTRFRKTLRYAAAASIIAVVLVTITLSIKRTEAGAIEPGSNTTVPANNTTSANRGPKQEADSFASALLNKKTGGANESGSDVASSERVTNKTTNQAVYSSLNEYVFFKDGDGKKRRVSKKIENLVRCKDGDIACQQRLQKLRQKLAANAMTSDFTGILEMLRQLQQMP